MQSLPVLALVSQKLQQLASSESLSSKSQVLGRDWREQLRGIGSLENSMAFWQEGPKNENHDAGLHLPCQDGVHNLQASILRADTS